MLWTISLSAALGALLVPLPLTATTPTSGCEAMTCIAGRFADQARAAVLAAQPRLDATLPRYQAAQDRLLRNLADATNEVATEALAQWILASREDVVRGGVQPIPQAIRARLAGHFPDVLLDRVRYRVGLGNDLALPSTAFRANAAAITLNDVIAFRDSTDAAGDARLWAHELTHVQQYERWGVRGFAQRYTLDHDGVEREADANAARILTAMAAR